MSNRSRYILLHNIGKSPSDEPHVASNYNTLEEILDTGVNTYLTFDGIYRNVWKHRNALADRMLRGRVILFPMGAYTGKDNSFDKGMPHEEYCTWDEIMDMCFMGAKLGYHTFTHPDLTTVSDDQLEMEIRPPYPAAYFSYPHGKYNDKVIGEVRKHYKKAFSVNDTDGTDYTIQRSYL